MGFMLKLPQISHTNYILHRTNLYIIYDTDYLYLKIDRCEKAYIYGFFNHLNHFSSNLETTVPRSQILKAGKLLHSHV